MPPIGAWLAPTLRRNSEPAEDYAPDYPHLAAALHAAGDDDIDDLGFELGLTALVAWLSAREP